MAYRAQGEALNGTYPPSSSGAACSGYSRSNSQSGGQVDFHPHQSKEKMKEEKKKYFTQKYGREQIMLIRKRLDVEEWMWDNLRIVYKCKSAEEDHNCEMDVDDLLDQDTDEDRRAFVQDKVADAKQSPQVVNQFIDELLQKLRTL